jgi:hypothetical protein
MGNSINLTCIEPDPERLLSLIKESDKARVRLIPRRLQQIDSKEFQALEANDILFVDSTHVSKVNSDVNRLLFEIFPALAPGVYIHLHDIFFPFEYPRDWIYEGRAWNEVYILRAFLQYNHEFQVVFSNNFMDHFHQTLFREKMPLCLERRGGSIWLRKNSVRDGQSRRPGDIV